MYVNSDIIFFTTSETGGNRVSIDNVYSVYDAENQIRYGSYYDYDTEEESAEAITLNYIVKGNIGSLEVEGEVNDINVSEDGKYLVFAMGNNSSECVLDLYSVSSSIFLKSFSKSEILILSSRNSGQFTKSFILPGGIAVYAATVKKVLNRSLFNTLLYPL